MYIQVHFRLDFIIEANAINPDHSDQVTYCLYYRQMTEVVIGDKRVIIRNQQFRYPNSRLKAIKQSSQSEVSHQEMWFNPLLHNSAF